jgi:hypothetical protein
MLENMHEKLGSDPSMALVDEVAGSSPCKGPMTPIEVHVRCTIFFVGGLILTGILDSRLYYNLQHTTPQYEAKTIRKASDDSSDDFGETSGRLGSRKTPPSLLIDLTASPWLVSRCKVGK